MFTVFSYVLAQRLSWSYFSLEVKFVFSVSEEIKKRFWAKFMSVSRESSRHTLSLRSLKHCFTFGRLLYFLDGLRSQDLSSHRGSHFSLFLHFQVQVTTCWKPSNFSKFPEIMNRWIIYQWSLAWCIMTQCVCMNIFYLNYFCYLNSEVSWV